MKISTKGQYALRMMLDLAMHNSGEYITIKSIAMRQSLPEKYLEQIMTVLSRASYVKSIRGSKGGYRLADDARKYTVGMILRTIEGSLAPVACLEEDMDPNSQNDAGETTLHLAVKSGNLEMVQFLLLKILVDIMQLIKLLDLQV